MFYLYVSHFSSYIVLLSNFFQGDFCLFHSLMLVIRNFLIVFLLILKLIGSKSVLMFVLLRFYFAIN